MCLHGMSKGGRVDENDKRGGDGGKVGGRGIGKDGEE